jgi:hypothetical protein
MPIPKPEKNENKQKFVARCMGNETMKKEYPDNQQRIAICLGQTRRKSSGNLLDEVLEVLGLNMTYNCESCGDTEGEELTLPNLIIPSEQDYVDFGEVIEEYDVSAIASEYQGRKVTLNKPFRTPDGPKKFSVYVKNEKGNVVKVNFGDPNMKIKKNIPERRKSFRARHNCDNPGPKWKARYWSCKAW